MAVDYVLVCDGCGAAIVRSRLSVRDARARAQLECRAYCGDGQDWCDSCRKARTPNPAGRGPRGHSIGIRR